MELNCKGFGGFTIWPNNVSSKKFELCLRSCKCTRILVEKNYCLDTFTTLNYRFEICLLMVQLKAWLNWVMLVTMLQFCLQSQFCLHVSHGGKMTDMKAKLPSCWSVCLWRQNWGKGKIVFMSVILPSCHSVCLHDWHSIKADRRPTNDRKTDQH